MHVCMCMGVHVCLNVHMQIQMYVFLCTYHHWWDKTLYSQNGKIGEGKMHFELIVELNGGQICVIL